MNTTTLTVVSIFVALLAIPAAGQESQHPPFSFYADAGPSDENQESEKPLPVRSFEFEIVTAMVEDFMMGGIMARLYIFDVENVRSHLTIRYSVDLSNGDMWFIPYYGVTVPRIGGFEIGVKPKQETGFFVPPWITWRIFGGDERIFAISADILTNVPIGSIGVYNAGVKFRISENGSMMYLGFANYGKNEDETDVFGPAIKTWWSLGGGSSLMVDGSYILKNPEDRYIRYTLSVGWRVSF